jgi:hypothetical protein
MNVPARSTQSNCALRVLQKHAWQLGSPSKYKGAQTQRYQAHTVYTLRVWGLSGAFHDEPAACQRTLLTLARRSANETAQTPRKEGGRREVGLVVCQSPRSICECATLFFRSSAVSDSDSETHQDEARSHVRAGKNSELGHQGMLLCGSAYESSPWCCAPEVLFLESWLFLGPYAGTGVRM